MNVSLIYNSLKYLTCNFNIIVKLSKDIYDMLITTKFKDLSKVIRKKDYELIDELIYFEQDIYSLAKRLRIYYEVQRLSNETIIYIILNCDDQISINCMFRTICFYNNYELVNKILNMNLKLDIDKALEIACTANRTDIAQLLIDHGADISRPRITYLHSMSSTRENYDICKLLVTIICESKWYKK